MQLICPHCTAKLQVSTQVLQTTSIIECSHCKESILLPKAVPPLQASHDRFPTQNLSPVVQSLPSAPLSQKTLIVAVTGAIAFIGVCALVVGAWYFGRSTNAVSAVPPTRSARSFDGEREAVDRQDAIVEDIKDDKRKLTKEIDDLKNQKKALEKDTENLDRQKLKLESELKDLTSRLEFIKPYRSADFVLVNPTSFAVAVKTAPDAGFMVVAKAELEKAQLAFASARNAGVPIIAHNRTLARQIHAETPVGSSVSPALSQQIREHWKVHKFVPPSPNDVADFVVFRDLTANATRVGFFVGASDDDLRYQPIGKAVETVLRSRIQSGSAVRGSGERVVPALNIADFLDFCVLSIAQKMQSQPNDPGLVCVALQMNVKALEDALRELTDRAKENRDEKKRVPQSRSWEGTGVLGVTLAFLGILMDRADTNNALDEWDRRREAIELLRRAPKYLEDELYAKLVKIGLPIVERENLAELLNESDLAKRPGFEARNYGRMLCATHMVIVEVKQPVRGGEYHISVRLDDVNTGKVIWAEEGDRIRRPAAAVNNFFLDAGRVVQVKLADAALPNFVPVEDPPIIPVGPSLQKGIAIPHLICVEDSTDDQMVLCRTLFTKETRSFPKIAFRELKPVDGVKDVPREHLLRYVAWRIARNTLPLAGRATSVANDRATISLGKATGIKPGDKLRVLRVVSASSSSDKSQVQNIAGSETLLPTDLSVAEVYDKYSTAVVGSSGLEEWWPESVSLNSRDLVIANAYAQLVLEVQPLALVPPTPAIFKALQLGLPVRAARYNQLSRQAGGEIVESLFGGLRKLNVNIVVGLAPMPNAGKSRTGTGGNSSPVANTATHVLIGTISPLSESKFHVDLAIKPAGTDVLLDHFEFDYYASK